MTIYGKGCISNYRNCSLSYVWYSVLYRMLTMYDGFIIQTHLTNGNSMTFPRTKDFPLHLLLFNNKAALH